nr:MAG TPA: hypothetical protein [Caudoviricetes sp.]
MRAGTPLGGRESARPPTSPPNCATRSKRPFI